MRTAAALRQKLITMSKSKTQSTEDGPAETLAVAAGSALSGYDRDVLRTAKENHIWLNAFACVRPTTEFRLQLADQILAMLNDKSNLIYDHQDSDDENWRALGKLTPELIVRINKS